MTETSAAYPMGGSQIEKQRLLSQAAAFEPQAKRLLEQIGIQPGWRAVDVGCGPIGILDLLSERVGPQGLVIGLEREPLFCEMAREEVLLRALKNVKIVQGDALSTGLEKQSFDLVHERLGLLNVQDRAAFLAEMVSLLRPGGTIVLENIDSVSWVCHPTHRSWDALRDALYTAFHGIGGDAFVGRRQPELLREAGIQNIQMKIEVAAPKPGDHRRTQLISLIDSIRGKVVSMGLMSETELNGHREALLNHLANPSTTVIDELFVQCWGEKPS